jgi:hypothetical protein
MRSKSSRVLLLASLVAVASCDRGATAPAPAASGGSAQTLLGSPTTVTVVRRNTPLAAPLTASATIGAFGGTINLPGAGLKVVVPPFALTSPKLITVTAVAGSQVAYEFQPHGIRFLVPLIVTQNLTGTSAVSGGLIQRPIFAGYFADLSDLDPLSNTGLISEVLGVSLSLLTKQATFPVFHFSGYLIATGSRPDASSMEEAGQQ